jgi:hypothetical protein
MCVDYHGLNRLTIKNWYFLPLILGLLDQLNHAKIYTKIDLRGAYNLVRIQEGDEWKITFKTCYIHFEYVVMPFGLTNALIVFQHMMNDVFWEYLDDFVVYYIDDIFIFGKKWQTMNTMSSCFGKVSKNWSLCQLEKCEFHQSKVKFLGYIIFRDGVCMDPCKVQTIVNWGTPTFVLYLRYCKFFLVVSFVFVKPLQIHLFLKMLKFHLNQPFGRFHLVISLNDLTPM